MIEEHVMCVWWDFIDLVGLLLGIMLGGCPWVGFDLAKLVQVQLLGFQTLAPKSISNNNLC